MIVNEGGLQSNETLSDSDASHITVHIHRYRFQACYRPFKKAEGRILAETYIYLRHMRSASCCRLSSTAPRPR